MDDDLVEIHMSEWPLVGIASQMHQHLQQIITHLSTMRSHYNPPENKRALHGLTLQVCKRVWRSVDELQDILGQHKCWIFRQHRNTRDLWQQCISQEPNLVQQLFQRVKMQVSHLTETTVPRPRPRHPKTVSILS